MAMQAPFIDVDTLTRNWWVALIRGIAGVLFGIATFIAPGVSLAVLVLLFGAYALVDGVLAVVTAVRRRDVSDRWWMLLLEGVVGIAAGVVTLVWPGITALALLYVIAAWALLTGALEIAAAIRLRKIIVGVVARPQRHRIDRAGHLADDFSRSWSAGNGALDRRLRVRLWRPADRAWCSLRSLGRSRAPHAARAA